MSVGRQSWHPERYARNARFVSDLGAPVLALLAPRPGERILDLGCGDGALTEKLLAEGAEVVAVDASPEQVSGAQARGLDARVMRGEALDFEQEFDAVFSNAALHWMKDADAVVEGVARALKPGGRFVGEFGGGDNVGRLRRALIAALDRRGHDGAAADPWYFPDEAEYEAKLAAAGFTVQSIELIPRWTPLPGSIDGWLETFSGAFLSHLPEEQHAEAMAEVREAVREELQDEEGRWHADYVRLRFSAQLTGAR